MRRFIHNRRKLTVFLILACSLAGLVGWDHSASIRGQLVAGFDVTRGHYEVLTAGLPVEWRPEYTRLLRERYGIEERVVAGCIVSRSLSAYVEGYNGVSMSAANRKFGHDVFRESAVDASRHWKRLDPSDYR
jgi:hypothetical protein